MKRKQIPDHLHYQFEGLLDNIGRENINDYLHCALNTALYGGLLGTLYYSLEAPLIDELEKYEA